MHSPMGGTGPVPLLLCAPWKPYSGVSWSSSRALLPGISSYQGPSESGSSSAMGAFHPPEQGFFFHVAAQLHTLKVYVGAVQNPVVLEALSD